MRPKDILPGESQMIERASRTCGSHFEAAETFLRTMVDEACNFPSADFPEVAKPVVYALFVKATCLYRSIILLSRKRRVECARVLNRSLFECYLNIAYILRGNFCIGCKSKKLSHALREEPEARASLYVEWVRLRDEKRFKRIKEEIPKHARLMDEHIDKLQQCVDLKICEELKKKLSRSSTCAGISIRDFAKRLDQGGGLENWYRVVYSAESQSVHSADWDAYLELKRDGTVGIKWFGTEEDIQLVLKAASTLYCYCAKALHGGFKLSKDLEKTIEAFAGDVKDW